jgi:hypothetical protein
MNTMKWPSFLRRFMPRPYAESVRCAVMVVRLPGSPEAADVFCLRGEFNRMAPDFWIHLRPGTFQVVCVVSNGGEHRIAAMRRQVEKHVAARPTMQGTRLGQAVGGCLVSLNSRNRITNVLSGAALTEAFEQIR